PDAKGDFGGPTGGPALTVAYPLSNSMMPPNLLQMKLQWQRDVTQKVFHIGIKSASFTRDLYLGESRCTGTQCTYPVPDDTWRKIGQALAGGQATLVIEGVAGKDGQIGTSPATVLNFSPEDVHGGIYYFSSTTRGIKRVPFGARQAI